MVDVDTTRINGSEIVALLLHLEIRKLRVNVFTGSLFCYTRATSTFPQVQKSAIYMFMYCRLF